MKHLILILAMVFSISANAQTIAGSNSESSSSSSSASGSQSNNANNVNIISSSPEQQSIFSKGELREAVTVNGQQHFKTNTPVMLTAGTSYSSDLCIATASGGASAAGISIGASKGIRDEHCEDLRAGEKFGHAAALAISSGNQRKGFALQAMSWWSFCTAGNKPDRIAACREAGVITDKDMPRVVEPTPVDE